MSNMCPACQYENREQARFCGECGAILVDDAVALGALTSGPDSLPALESPGNAGLDGDAATLPGISTMTAAGYDGFDWSPSDLPSDGEEAFATGTLIAGRYFVLASSGEEMGHHEYLVEDRGVCRACAAEIEISDDEPYCPTCGAHLPQLSLPWPPVRLQEIEPDTDGGEHLVWQGRTFALIDAAGTTAADVPCDLSSRHDAASGADEVFARGVHLLAGQRSEVGNGRAGRTNEDSLFVLTMTAVADSLVTSTVGLYLVADGMGGHLDGDVASRAACEVISAELFQSLHLPSLLDCTAGSDAVAHVEQAIQKANRHIHDLAEAGGNNMGTTLVLALVLDGRVCIANVGDSRAYRWGCEGLQQLTEDHSHVFTLAKNGLIDEDEIYTHPRRSEIYRSLGGASMVEVDCYQFTFAPDDVLLLCSDGLWEMLRTEGIADVLALNLGDPQVICDELVRRANDAGGDDNISVVVARVAG